MSPGRNCENVEIWNSGSVDDSAGMILHAKWSALSCQWSGEQDDVRHEMVVRRRSERVTLQRSGDRE